MAHEVHRQKGISPSDSTKKQTSQMVLSDTCAHRPNRNRGFGKGFLGATFFIFLGRCSTGGCIGTLAGGRNPPVDLLAAFFTNFSFFFGGEKDMVACSSKGTILFITRFERICEDDDEEGNCFISASSWADTLLTRESCCSLSGTGGNLPFSSMVSFAGATLAGGSTVGSTGAFKTTEGGNLFGFGGSFATSAHSFSGSAIAGAGVDTGVGAGVGDEIADAGDVIIKPVEGAFVTGSETGTCTGAGVLTV
jgi:hypothetical protein